MWESEQVPKDLKDAVVIIIFKKGDRNACGNYRGISLLSIAGKIFARILLNRLQVAAEEILPVWLSTSPRHHRHDLLCQTNTRKEQRAAETTILCFFMIWRKPLTKSQEQPCGWSSEDWDVQNTS